MRANIRRILKTDAAGVESFVGNGQGIFARLGDSFAHGKGIFAALGLSLEPHKLHDNVVVAHFPAGTTASTATAATAFFARLARLRLGGVPSASSTTMMLVTNFFMP